MKCDTCQRTDVHVKKSPLTPPSDLSTGVVDTALTILKSQADSITHLYNSYAKDERTREEYVSSIRLMHDALLLGGKIVISGMGKSGLIGDKLCATMNSLGIFAATLHPCDALHGDLGVIRPADVILMISASGNTPELISLLPHLPQGIPKIALTCNPDSFLAKESAAILSAEIPQGLTEKKLYGVPAPTTTTTASLAVGDAVCLTLAELITADHEQRKRNFGKWHPGGAIGQDYQKDTEIEIGDLMTPWTEVGQIPAKADELQILRAAAGREWVNVGNQRLVKARDVVENRAGAGYNFDGLRRVPASGKVGGVKRNELVLVTKSSNVVGIYQAE
ncbi:uncharacterized protein V1510DRAFT_423812 [Dipodascopsis tothii]|uniref:uncharacterized protein n=1 Tax=Dipodascopsis tothii TaxID=44089 RepID=UPI0034CFAFE3